MWRLYILLNTFIFVYGINPGPDIQPSKGEVWPKPLRQEKYGKYYLIDPIRAFNFEVSFLASL